MGNDVRGEAREEPAVRTVALVDRHPLSSMGLERVLSSRAGLRHVASVKEPGQLRLLARQPDVVVIAMSAADDVGAMLEAFDVTRNTVAVLEEACDFAEVVAAIRSGVGGLATRATDPAELLFAVHAVARGGCYLSSELTARIREGRMRRESDRPALTPRELETATWLVKGLTHRQIARRMGLTEETVNTYVKRLRSKLGVGNKAALTRKVIESGYLTGDHTS